MRTCQKHYDELLARHYSWLWGGFDLKAEENKAFFQSYSITPSLSGRAVDLGCGSGFQAVPLAKAGFSVTAIDLSQDLLGELAGYAEGLDVTTVNSDILSLAAICRERLELAVCMGDTLTHLPTKEDVRKMFKTVFQTLEPSGMFIVTYRDLSFELKGLDRFIPVRSDDTANFTCFLEYQDDTVVVHDLINERVDDGWSLKKSCYPKLRLPADWVADSLETAGFTLETKEVNMGLVTCMARKPE